MRSSDDDMMERDEPHVLSRRAALVRGALAVGVVLGRRATMLDLLQGQPAPPPGGLVVRNQRPLDAEAPIEALESFITPNDHFFVRCHLQTTPTLPSPWTLTIDGAVSQPVTLTLAEIQRLGGTRQPVTLECAGNGRGNYELPRTGGVQWRYGAVSNAEWTGIPLAAVLERARFTPDAQHLWLEAADRAPLPAAPKMLRSLPRALATEHAFLVWEMNGEPIPVAHGGPLRLLMPGWFGMASPKWLTHIHAAPKESDNYFMASGYRFADGTPVQRMQVKSLIVQPSAGQQVPTGSLLVRGQAWTGLGAGGIRSVDLSLDDGATWQPASLEGREYPYAWRSWRASVTIASPGPQRLLARATDASGRTQPRQATPNPGGFANNSMHEVRFDAVHA